MIARLVHTWRMAAAILWAAAWLVPRRSRAEWLAEWRGELWHVGVACGAARANAVHGRRRITAFCLGAFKDAGTLRLVSWRACFARWLEAGTASRCLVLLAALFLVSLGSALCRTEVRAGLWGGSVDSTDNLVLVTQERYQGEAEPTIGFAQYEAWKANPFPFARRLVFYRTAWQWVRGSDGRGARLRVGYASESMLGVLAPTATRARQARPEVLVARGAKAGRFGREIEIEGQRFAVTGVARDDWNVPGGMDAVVIESDAALERSLPETPGFLLAPGIEPALRWNDPGHPYVLAFGVNGGVTRYECGTLAERRTRPTALFLFALVLAALALPATTPLPLGDYPAEDCSPGTAWRARRWALLGSKVALGVGTVFCLSLSLGYAGLPEDSPGAESLQLLLAVAGLLFVLRWALRDQRRRCPKCLRLLTGAAHVGHPSRSFLAWHGTELLCASGHGMLYIPEHPTSWCSTQRWRPLDASWGSLFLT
jgi:hypothetical protein